MAYLLDGTEIRRPLSIVEHNLTQFAQQKTLAGEVGRDYFGSNKRVWTLTYDNTNKTDYDAMRAIYDDHLDSGNTKTWQSTELNYTVAETDVHIDLQLREFTVRGSDYLSSFTLILTEA